MSANPFIGRASALVLVLMLLITACAGDDPVAVDHAADEATAAPSSTAAARSASGPSRDVGIAPSVLLGDIQGEALERLRAAGAGVFKYDGLDGESDREPQELPITAIEKEALARAGITRVGFEAVGDGGVAVISREDLAGFQDPLVGIGDPRTFGVPLLAPEVVADFEEPITGLPDPREFTVDVVTKGDGIAEIAIIAHEFVQAQDSSVVAVGVIGGRAFPILSP